jgi:hypothetical protein
MTERRKKKQDGYVETPPDFYAMDRTHPLPRNNECHLASNDEQKQPSTHRDSLGYKPAAATDRILDVPRPLAAAPADSSEADIQQELTQLRILHQEIVNRINEISQRAQRPAIQLPQPEASASTDVSDFASRTLLNLMSSGQVQPQQLISAMSALGLASASSSSVQQQITDSSASALYQFARNLTSTNLPSINNLPPTHLQQQLLPSAVPDSNPLLAQLLRSKLLQQQVQPTLQQEQQQQQLVNVFGNVLAAFLAQRNDQQDNK